jgi:hypothetical protein
MPAPEIHIDRLELDLRGIPPSVAQSALSSLGPALQESLAARMDTPPGTARAHLASVVAPVIRVPAGADAATLRRALAGQLASTIASQLPPPSNL